MERLQAIYFDTPDERLRRQWASIRLRKEGRHWVQTAKAVTNDSIRRLEHNAPISLPSGMLEPALDLSRHDGTPVGEALRRALGNDNIATCDTSLAERFRTDVRRIARTVRVSGARVEMSLDTGKIIAGDRSVPVAEFELELASGTVEALMGLAARWAERHRLWVFTISKAERGARLVRGETEGRPVTASVPAVVEKPDARSFLVATLKSCLTQVLGNASEIGAGATNEEFVHQLRVGLRRLRTALRELRADRDGAAPDWALVLRSAFQELGRHRDCAIVLPAVRAKLDAAGIASSRVPEPLSIARSPADLVCDAAFQRTVLGVVAFMHERAGSTRRAVRHRRGVRAAVAKRLARLERRLVRDAERFARVSSARQHRVRKRLKRLRYLSEFATPMFASADVNRYLRAWRLAQDALGEFNDHRVATDAFRAQAAADPKAGLAIAWLKSRRPAMAKRCQRALRKASRTKPFWTG